MSDQHADQSCRTCVYLDKGDAKRIFSNRAYPCLAPIPPMPPMPECIRNFMWPTEMTKSYTCPDYGKSCPVYKRMRKK